MSTSYLQTGHPLDTEVAQAVMGMQDKILPFSTSLEDAMLALCHARGARSFFITDTQGHPAGDYLCTIGRGTDFDAAGFGATISEAIARAALASTQPGGEAGATTAVLESPATVMVVQGAEKNELQVFEGDSGIAFLAHQDGKDDLAIGVDWSQAAYMRDFLTKALNNKRRSVVGFLEAVETMIPGYTSEPENWLDHWREGRTPEQVVIDEALASGDIYPDPDEQ
jgi:hypothetical protein